MASYVIGDIHGGYLALQQVLQKVPLVKGDKLVFIGDYVDGWSQSFEVVRMLISLAEIYDCKFLLGNHDLWMANWLRNGDKPKVWVENGGQAAMDSYRKATKKELAVHTLFFQKLLNYYIDENGRLFVHGGFTAPGGIAEEENFLTFITDRSLWKAAMDHDFDNRFNNYLHIFIGHTPTIRMGAKKPVTIRNITNTDTGAAFTGRLSVVNIDTLDCWQSVELPALYPGEKGRN